ncbi:MAG: 50S ribosomal protein L32e [Desulfurococcales archaeon]|nr:50S ribosomal protein L32e [Desulfurococcales archaeon]
MSSREAVRATLKAKARLRKKLAARRNKPVFRRYLSWRFWKFERREYWRKPKGIDNKMRLQLKGYPPIVKVGYRTEKSIRGLHPSGLVPVRVFNVKDLENLDPAKHIVVVASTVGLKKKLAIVEAAEQRGFRVANP